MNLTILYLLGALAYYLYLRYYKGRPNADITPYDLALWPIKPLQAVWNYLKTPHDTPPSPPPSV